MRERLNTTSVIGELRKELANNPHTEKFYELADILSSSDIYRAEAREICFRGLNEHPRSVKGRFVLAKLFYLDGLVGFCLRELYELRGIVQSYNLDKLIESLGGSIDEKQIESKEVEEESVLAQIDLDSDIIDLYNKTSQTK